MKKIEALLGKDVFVVEGAEFYRFNKHNGANIAIKIEPILQNEFLEIYALHLEGGIFYVPVSIVGKRRFVSKFMKNSKEFIPFVLIGEDFAFGETVSSGVIGQVKNWHLISWVGNEYFEMNKEYCKADQYVSHVEYDLGVLKIHIKGVKYFDEDVFLVKTAGGYRRITHEEAEKKKEISQTIAKTIPIGWKNVKEFGIFDEEILNEK